MIYKDLIGKYAILDNMILYIIEEYNVERDNYVFRNIENDKCEINASYLVNHVIRTSHLFIYDSLEEAQWKLIK